MRMVVVGSGFGGLNAAIELKKQFKDEHDIIVISDSNEFIFRPSIIWIPFHEHSVEHLTFPLKATYDKIGVTFINNRVKAIDPEQNQVICENEDVINYDYLVIATGAEPDWSQIPGLAGRSFSVYDIPAALETKKRIQTITDQDQIVIGVAQDNPNSGIAYEFVFECRDYLQKQNIHCPITFFTYETNLYQGKGMNTTQKLDKLMNKKHINYITDVSIDNIDQHNVYLSNNQSLPYTFLFVLPPYKGKECIFASPNLKHKNGILPVFDTLQSKQWENIYVVGDANQIPTTKTGRAADIQGKLAAKNINKQLLGEPPEFFEDNTLYLMEIGKDGALFVVHKETNDGTISWNISGMLPHMLKRAYEKFYIRRFS